MQENYKQQTLENLEKTIWPTISVDEESYLIKTCTSLRKKQLGDFSIEDLRVMISQNIGLHYLIPIAIEKLNENILVEGDYYEGDLLIAVLTSDVAFWKTDYTKYKIVSDLFERNEQLLKDFDTTWEIRKKWFDSFKNFNLIG